MHCIFTLKLCDQMCLEEKVGVPHCSAAMWNPPTTPWGTFNENSCFLDVYYFISDLHITFLPCTRTGLIFPRFYWGIHLLYELRIPPMPTAPYNVSQTSAARFLSVWQAKEVEWKNCSPAHCGHMAREESSRSGARRPQSGIFVVCFPLCCIRLLGRCGSPWWRQRLCPAPCPWGGWWSRTTQADLFNTHKRTCAQTPTEISLAVDCCKDLSWLEHRSYLLM